MPADHKVRIDSSRIWELITPGDGEEHGRMVAWLLAEDRGWVAVETVSNDPSMPYQRPIAMFDGTDEFNSWSLEDELRRDYHIDTGQSGPVLTTGAVLFEFGDASTATAFKLMFG